MLCLLLRSWFENNYLDTSLSFLIVGLNGAMMHLLDTELV